MERLQLIAIKRTAMGTAFFVLAHMTMITDSIV